MRSCRLVSVIISVLLVLVILLVFKDRSSTIGKDGKSIALEDPSDIDKIILYDLHDSTWLIKNGEEWLLFGKERVNPVAVENVLFAAERLQIISIASENTAVPGSAVKSIIYFKGEKELRAYRFWAQGDQYLLKPAGSDRNFQVSLAGYPDLNLDRVFSSSANHYREHLMIDLLPSEISIIEVELANGHSFRFTQNETNEIACSPSNENTNLPSGSLDELATRLLFSYFTAIRYESKPGISIGTFRNNERNSERIATLRVVSKLGEEHALQVFPFYDDTGAKAHLFKALVLYNNDPEVLVVNYIYLDVLMRDLHYYFGE